MSKTMEALEGITQNLFNTGSTYTLRGYNYVRNNGEDAQFLMPILNANGNFEIIRNMEKELISTDIGTEFPTYGDSPNLSTYINSINNLFSTEHLKTEETEKNTMNVFFVKTANIAIKSRQYYNSPKNKQHNQSIVESVSIGEAFGDLLEFQKTSKAKNSKTKDIKMHNEINADNCVCTPIRESLWFSEYFDYAFEMPTNAQDLVTTNSNQNMILVDYLQKDLKFGFYSMKEIKYAFPKDSKFNKSKNIKTFMKVSPVRVIAFDYETNVVEGEETSVTKHKRVCELIGSHVYNTLLAHFSGIKTIDGQGGEKVLVNRVKAPIVGYIVEFFYSNDKTGGTPVQMDGNMLAEIVEYMMSHQDWNNILIDDLRKTSIADIINISTSVYNLKEYTNLNSEEVLKEFNITDNMKDTRSLRDVLYLARESHDICLYSGDPNSKYDAYFKMIQKYYRDTLDVKNDITMAPYVEYEKNYVNTLVLSTAAANGMSFGCNTDRIGIYLPTLINKYKTNWFNAFSNIQHASKLLIDAVTAYTNSLSDEVSKTENEFVLDREMVINYQIGSYTPMFIFDISATRNDPFHKIKSDIISYCLSMTDDEKFSQHTSQISKDVIYNIKNKIFAFSKEMYTPKCLENTNKPERYKSVLTYRENNTEDKITPNKTNGNEHVIDIDLFNDQKFILDPNSKESMDNIIPCNISINMFVADVLRKSLKPNTDWSIIKDMTALPTIIQEVIQTKSVI